MYTIKRAAELTGVAVATLRAWERRYGIGAPARSESGYRLYNEQNLQSLGLMRDLVDSGWAPRQAADEVARQEAEGGSVASAANGGFSVGGGAGDDLVAAAIDLSPGRLAQILDERFGRTSFETVVDAWLLPTLQEAGRAWATGALSVAGEHLLAGAVHRRLAAAYEAAAREPAAATVLVGLPPGARHELGALAFAVAARRAGLPTAYLGADVPAADWSLAVARHRPQWAVLAVPRAEDLAGLLEVTALMDGGHPGVRVAVGGQFQDLAPVSAMRLGHTISGAATLLLGATTHPTPRWTTSQRVSETSPVSAARPASRRAIGTRNGEQET